MCVHHFIDSSELPCVLYSESRNRAGRSGNSAQGHRRWELVREFEFGLSDFQSLILPKGTVEKGTQVPLLGEWGVEWG